MEFTSKRYEFKNKTADYAGLAEELNGLLAGEQDFIANAANTAALLFDALPGHQLGRLLFHAGRR